MRGIGLAAARRSLVPLLVLAMSNGCAGAAAPPQSAERILLLPGEPTLLARGNVIRDNTLVDLYIAPGWCFPPEPCDGEG